MDGEQSPFYVIINIDTCAVCLGFHNRDSCWAASPADTCPSVLRPESESRVSRGWFLLGGSLTPASVSSWGYQRSSACRSFTPLLPGVL